MKVRAKKTGDGKIVGYDFFCPGCKDWHHFNTAGEGPVWGFNGNLEKPTFSPSLLRVREWPGMEFERRCHLFVIDGVIHFCSDCFHHFSNKKVEMIDIEELT